MKLKVFYDNTLAGYLERRGPTANPTYIFQYDAKYVEHKDSRSVSVNLPLQKEAYESDILFPFFDNLLAEGWLLDIQSSALKIDKDDRFALVSQCGLECVGAVSLLGDEDDEALLAV
ncbi:MAG: HipA N-terminal domain-containing protein [Bdellovibrionales bacterium]|nr:HipA N-terminal domain-containing protein [Bdellovibrionales bacterium]